MREYKRIPLLGMKNCRDLGGYACGEDGFFRYHRLYRADAPVNLSEQEWGRIYNDMNVRTIIDLRSDSERRYMEYQTPEGIDRINLSLMKEEIELDNISSIESSSARAFGLSLLEGYTEMMRSNAGQVTRVLKLTAEGLTRGAVLYHCSAGKDRTGIVSALIYLLCGVSEADIIADYQVTAVYLAGKQILKQEIPEQIKALMKSAPETMEEFLKTVREENLLDKLYREGLTQQDVDLLRSKVIAAD